MLPKSQSSGEFVGTFCYYYCYLLLLLLLLSLCVCVCYPCKQFVVVTIRRTGSWNTIPTLPYLTHLFLSDSDKIYRDSSSIHRLVSRKNDYSGRQKLKEVSLGTNFKLVRELIGIDYHSNQFSKYSRRALEKTFTLVVVIIRKAETKPNQTEEYINLQGGSSLFFYDQQLASLAPIPKSIQYKTRQEKKRKKTQNNNNIKTMTHHRMGFTPSSSSTSTSSSSTTTTKPSATTTKKSPQRACLGGMVITPCEKCTIRTYVSLSIPLYPIPSNMIITLPLPYSTSTSTSSLSSSKSYRIPRP